VLEPFDVFSGIGIEKLSLNQPHVLASRLKLYMGSKDEVRRDRLPCGAFQKVTMFHGYHFPSKFVTLGHYGDK
jgi:hypothetical protein